jgi:PST family polysaccharide transporter
MMNAVSEYNTITSAVLFPAFSELQDDPGRLRRGYLGGVALSVLMLGPVLSMLAFTAPELIRGLFGPKWSGAVAPFQVLCVGGIFRSFGIGDSLIRAKGAVYPLFWRYSVFAASVVLACLAGSSWGVTGIATGITVAWGLNYFLIAQLALSLSGLSWKNFFRSLVPGTAVTVCCMAATIPVTLALRASCAPDLLTVTGAVLAGGVVAQWLTLALPRSLRNPELDLALSRALRALALHKTILQLQKWECAKRV